MQCRNKTNKNITTVKQTIWKNSYVFFSPISKNATGWNEPMNRVADGPHKNSKLIPAINSFLFDAEDDWAKIFVISKIIPVFGSIEILFVGLLFDRCQLESLILLPLFLDGGFLPRNVISIDFVFFEETKVLSLFKLFLLLFSLFCICDIAVTFALIPYRVCCDLLPGAFNPISRCGD